MTDSCILWLRRWLAQLLINLGHAHNDPLFQRDIHEPTVLQA